MADRNWTNMDCLTYLFTAFAVYTDGDLDDDEKRVIVSETKKYVPDDAEDLHLESLNKTLGWFNEDLKSDENTDDNDVVINTFVNIANYLKEKFDTPFLQHVHDDLVRIGKADGNYDKVEEGWAKIFAEVTGTEH